MSRIRILPDDISNRIAAGEVIERPASILKELVENSLDARANRIAVRIEQAGKRLISITDDGCGMDADDALLCLEAHATSKIRDVSDIDRIITLGFRGEALPSIASVTRFRLRSREADAMSGTEVLVEGGRFRDVKPVGCAPGTEIIARDLFFNTPARRKFLRTDATEEKHIIETLQLLALANPETAFEFILDGREIMQSPGDPDLRQRIQTVFGRSFAKAIIPVEFTQEEIQVSGFISRHGFTRSSRREQRCFVNGRPIESPLLYHVLSEAYGSLVMKGRYPAVILFIKLPPEMVDVNVHPAKREIRFRSPGKIRTAVQLAIQKTLREASAPSSAISPTLNLQNVLAKAELHYQPRETMPPPMPELNFSTPSQLPQSAAAPREESRQPDAEESSQITAETEKRPAQFPAVEQLKILGFLEQTYIVALAPDGLMLIDQHAAHERILFEEILAAASSRKTASQNLLLPITLELARNERIFLMRHAESFQEIGFSFESFGADTVLVTAIPAALPQENINGLFVDMLDQLADGALRSGPDRAAIARAACKHAVKAHDQLSPEEARALLRRMASCELPFSCPHGRPTMIQITLRELEKRFGRRG